MKTKLTKKGSMCPIVILRDAMNISSRNVLLITLVNVVHNRGNDIVVWSFSSHQARLEKTRGLHAHRYGVDVPDLHFVLPELCVHMPDLKGDLSLIHMFQTTW